MSRANFVQVQLAAAATSSQTLLTVKAPVGALALPPADGGRLVLTDSPGRPTAYEIITYTSRTGSGPYTLNGVTRGVEGTDGLPWAVDTFVIQSLTVGELDELLAGKVDKTTQVIAGTGLEGGGDLTADRTLSVKYGTTAGTAAEGNDSRLSDSREWTASTVSQAEAEAGTATTARKWTAQRVRQAVAAFAAPLTRLIVAGTGLEGGGDLSVDRTLSVKYGTTAGTAAEGNDSRLSDSREWTAAVVTQAEAEAGTATTARKWTAQRVRQAVAAFAAPLTRLIVAGTGLEGGGDLTADRTLSVKYGTTAGTAAEGNDSRLSNSREWTASTVTQAEAEAGTATTRRAWTAQRVRQAIVAWWNGATSAWGRGLVSSADAAAGRTALGLGTAATYNVGESPGQVMPVGAFGLGSSRYYSTSSPPDGSLFVYAPGSQPTNYPLSYGYGAGLSIRHGYAGVSAEIIISHTTASEIAFRAARTLPWYKLYHTGNFNPNSVSGNLSVSGSITATGNITAYSDVRLKTDIQTIPDALDKVCQLGGYTYLRTDTGERQTGVIAQEVQKVLPEAVTGDEYLGVAYGNMAGLFVEAIKELRQEVSELKKRLGIDQEVQA